MVRERGEALRIGGVSFLNARPLVRYLDPTRPPATTLTLEIPSRLSDMMQGGQLDVALLPSIEYFRSRDYKIVPDISISANGIVSSVCIFSKVPMDKIRSLALDESSRTSIALSKILLKRKLGTLPHFTTCSPESCLNELATDAILLIGDSAMTFRKNHSTYVIDLGNEWKQLTGLPFVYAVWVCRSDADTTGLAAKLAEARERGLANLTEIAEEACRQLGLSFDTCLSYLRDTMKYGLGAPELQALQTFHDMAAEDGLCPGDVDIVIDG